MIRHGRVIAAAVLLLAWTAGGATRAAVAAAAAETGTIRLTVDATDIHHGVLRSREVIPVEPGVVELAYPQWVQGEHTPTGPITQVVDFGVEAAGRALPWRRDALRSFVVRVEVPAGVRELTVRLTYLSPPDTFGEGYGETPNMTPHLVVVDWHDLLVYPLGRAIDQIPFAATVRLPAGWKYDTALPARGGAGSGGDIAFETASLYTLIDSPVLAGEYFRHYEIAPRGEAGPPVYLSVAADRRAAADVPEERLAAFRRVVGEAAALFGAHHYRAYRWLLALGDQLAEDGLEHHESSDDRGRLGMFSDPALMLQWATLLPHEYVHSWNGKYRRPEGLAVEDAQEPLRTGLLWVYEGLTRYLGDLLLTARSGLRTPDQARDYLAYVAATQDRARPGRLWRSLGDTATGLPVFDPAPAAWTAWRRGRDYYEEGMLVWFEADTLLRTQSGGKRSLDDFCRAFFGAAHLQGAPSTLPAPATSPASPSPASQPSPASALPPPLSPPPPNVEPYTAEDLLSALGRIQPFDWRGFFARRIDDIAPHAPLGGIEAAGWRLVYDDRPNQIQSARAQNQDLVDLSFSLGFWAKPDGTVIDVVTGSPAWDAGLAPGTKLLAIGHEKWSSDAAAQSLQAAQRSPTPIALTLEQDDEVHTLDLDYHQGDRHPHLERDPARPDLLQAILAPHAR